MTASIAPSLISTDPDWASRKKTSPVAPVALSASSATSTVASLVRRSLMSQRSSAGGSCPGVGGARSPHPPRLPRRSLRSRRVAGPRGTRGSRTTRSPVPPRVGSGCSSCWSSLGLAHELDSVVSALVAHRLVDVENRLVLEVVVGAHLVNAECNCLHHGFEFEATCDSASATGARDTGPIGRDHAALRWVRKDRDT